MDVKFLGTIFLAGIYGTGKSTLGSKVAHHLNIPFYSAGDLISEINGEKYGVNKIVKDKYANQDVLSVAVQKKLQKSKDILLAGHFCIFDTNCKVETLPLSVFEKISIDKIILLEAPLERVYINILNRDSKSYSLDDLNNLLVAERESAKLVKKKLSIPLYIHNMEFSDSDLSVIIRIINS